MKITASMFVQCRENYNVAHRKTQESNLYLHNLWLLHTELVYVVVVLECEEQCIGTTRRKVFTVIRE